MLLDFQMAGGSVAGRDHRRGVPRNNQDAYHIAHSPHAITALVADGCSSSEYSEYGARFGVTHLTELLHTHLGRGRLLDAEGLLRVRDNFAAEMRVEANKMGPSLSEVVNSHFLFTMLGAIITPKRALFIAIGDGVFAVNGEVTILPPQTDNKPPYLGYLLTGSDVTDTNPELLQFQVVYDVPTDELDSFLVGSDGVVEFIERAADLMPGTKRPVGPLSQFWTGDHYFDPEKPKALKLQLHNAARDRYQATPTGRQTLVGGLIGDDITVCSGRRTTSS
jgi:hypothetical protein